MQKSSESSEPDQDEDRNNDWPLEEYDEDDGLWTLEEDDEYDDYHSPYEGCCVRHGQVPRAAS